MQADRDYLSKRTPAVDSPSFLLWTSRTFGITQPVTSSILRTVAPHDEGHEDSLRAWQSRSATVCLPSGLCCTAVFGALSLPLHSHASFTNSY